MDLHGESLSWIAGGGGDAGVAELAGDDADVDALGAELGAHHAEASSTVTSTVMSSM